jgi:hypothetical protein
VTANGFGAHTFSAGGAGSNSIRVRNTTDGAANAAIVYIDADNAVGDGLSLRQFATSYTPAGADFAGGATIYQQLAGGLSIAATHASGDVRIYSRNALAATFGASQAVTFTGSLTISTGVAGDQSLLVRNTTSGATALSTLRLTAGTQEAILYNFSQGYTTSGPNIAAGLTITSFGAGGLQLYTDAGPIRFYSGGTTLAGTMHASRGFSWGDATDPGATNFRVAGTITAVGTIGAAAINASAAVNISSSLQCDSIVNDTGLAHGTYSPGLTNTTNVAASGLQGTATYMRVGNTVHVIVRVTIDPTAAAPTATQLDIALPVASNFAAATECIGMGWNETIAQIGHIESDITNNRASYFFSATSVAGSVHVIMFSYQVI